MNLDMTIQGGGIGGSSGLLDWGSDIARMWGLGMVNGANMANLYRDLQRRSALEPSAIEAGIMQNQLAQQQTQNAYTQAYDLGRADNVEHSQYGGYLNHNIQGYNTPLSQTPTQQQRAVAVAPRGAMQTVIANGLFGAGHSNATPQLDTGNSIYTSYGNGG